MIPHERSLVERYHGRPLAVLGVNCDENPDLARKAIATQGITWRNWQQSDGEHSIDRRWEIPSFPAVFVIDANGVIRHEKVVGPALDRAVESLVAEAETKASRGNLASRR
jgi:hypothetical protein